jgi:tRNA (guanosine-2'-O-)-methyltransferase
MARQSNRHQLPPQGSAEHFALWDYYHEYITPERRARLGKVLSQRTRRLTVVLEDVRQSHNVSAVLRSCDAFGIQDVHVLEPVESFDPSTRVALGSQRWLTIRREPGEDAIRRGIAGLKHSGYRIVATVPPNDEAVPFDKLEFDRPIAVVFGNEKEGISSEMAAAADVLTTIPMCGFVESLNISVAAALLVQNLSSRLRQTREDWRLSQAEFDELLFEWTRKSVPAVDLIEQRWLAERQALSDQHPVTAAARVP